MAERMTPAEVNISYIVTYLLHRPPSAPIRTFVDEWFAYHRGGEFLNSQGKPQWFNKPSPIKRRKALLDMHFQSDAALDVLNGTSNQDLIKEHAVPIKVLIQLLSEIEKPNFKNVEDCLLSNYRLGVLTKSDDQRLNELKLRSSMPDDWDGINVWARYTTAGISGNFKGTDTKLSK